MPSDNPQRKKSSRKRSVRLEKEAIAEAGGLCAWCRKPEPLDVHHIDEDRSNTVPENLVALCKNCHDKAAKGFPSPADLTLRKRELQWQRTAIQSHGTAAPKKSVKIKKAKIAQFADTINNYKGVNPPRPMPAADSIGANAAMKSYVQYLINRYIWCRVEEQKHGDTHRFHPAAAKNIVESALGGFSPYGAPQSSFASVTECLVALVRRTKWAHQINFSPHSWEEHQELLRSGKRSARKRATSDRKGEVAQKTPYDATVDHDPLGAVRAAWRDVTTTALALMDAKKLRPDPSKQFSTDAIASALKHFCFVDAEHLGIFLSLADNIGRIEGAGAGLKLSSAVQFCGDAWELISYLKTR